VGLRPGTSGGLIFPSAARLTAGIALLVVRTWDNGAPHLRGPPRRSGDGLQTQPTGKRMVTIEAQGQTDLSSAMDLHPTKHGKCPHFRKTVDCLRMQGRLGHGLGRRKQRVTFSRMQGFGAATNEAVESLMSAGDSSRQRTSSH